MRIRDVIVLTVALTSTGSAAALAAERPPQPGEGEPTEATGSEAPATPRFGEVIVITGSRIPRKDLTTPAPVTVLTREQLLASGALTVGDFLQRIPEQGNALNASVNNGGDGSVRVNLRGLGEHRTLVLLNGRRFVAGGSGANTSVDLGTLPAAVVQRIEVLKDGASAVYGSDAVGGVVNIVTRERFDGVEASAFSGISPRGDGATYDVAVTTGRSGEHAGLLFSAGYSRQEAVWAGDRDFSRIPLRYCQNAPGQDTPNAQGNNCTQRTKDGLTGAYGLGSGIGPQGRFQIPSSARGQPLPNPQHDPRIDRYNTLVTEYPDHWDFIRDPKDPAGWRPFRGSELLRDGGDGYNFQPENYLVTPSQRISLFALGDTRLGDGARAFFEASFVNRQSQQKLAPEPLATASAGVVVSADNVFNPFGVDLFAVDRRLVEFSNRSFTQDVDALRVVGGLDGTLPAEAGPLRGWFWELSMNHGRTQSTEVNGGLTRVTRLQDALGPSFRDATGAHCGTPGHVIAGCVPLDLFGGAGSITKEQVAGLTFTGTARGTNQLTAFQANTSGELFSLFAERPAGLAIGYEYRRVSGSNLPDPLTVAGEVATGTTVKVTRGSQAVHETYAELSLPIVSARQLARSVEVTAAARAFKYDGFAADWTWKLGARWTPLRDVTLRGTWSTAFRAPAVAELYYGESTDRMPAIDPCAGTDGEGHPRAIPATCRPEDRNGNPTPVVDVHGGGNPRLRPESARIFTMGVVLEPSFAKDLTVTLDAFGVRIDGAVHPVGGFAVDTCYPTAAGAAPQYCRLITRDPTTHDIVAIDNSPQNSGSERMAGADLAVRYALRTGHGRYALTFDGTWLQHYDLVLPDGSVDKARGTYEFLSSPPVGGVYPAFKFNAGASWQLGGVGAGALVRFIGSFKECGSADGTYPGSCHFDGTTYSRSIEPYQVWNAFVSYAFRSAAGTTSLALGAQNVFDRRPATIYNGALATSDPTAYDFMGRFVYLRVTQRL